MNETASGSARREDLRATIAQARTEALSFRDSIKDARTRDALALPIITRLGDVERMYLSDDSEHAPWWFDWAEYETQAAKAALRAAKKIVDQYGGPDNVRTVG